MVKLVQANRVKRGEVSFLVEMLAKGERLPEKYKDHELKGSMVGIRECHIRGDVLLLYEANNKYLLLDILDIGTHSQLFG